MRTRPVPGYAALLWAEKVAAWRRDAVFELPDERVDPEQLEGVESALRAWAPPEADPAPPPPVFLSRAGSGDQPSEEAPVVSTASGGMDPDTDLGAAEWLAVLGLGRYSPALVGAGYDDPSVWSLMLESEFQEMCDHAAMLPGHRVKLLAALRGTVP
eukprot:CAMPEP_0172623000 /NCGR_PEP_ID=MMETSP1068-20121228/124897_1 /TAXON_ID=35684 /ORGANISM="Pseudopedinella elastica, Strain CCMP716" /LENGTH=156 /DNA_ID=CAMNT_0013431381 /DNA_START=1 /DNA_END=471 /DNA_ORIENTATION=+